MANDLNKCMFIGNLGKDPESRATAAGSSVTNFSIAVGKVWKDKAGVKQEKTTWVRCVTFGKLADICAQYLQKGSKVFVCGEYQERKWHDQEGNDRYSSEFLVNEMQMLNKVNSGQQHTANQQSASQDFQTPQGEFDDDIPF